MIEATKLDTVSIDDGMEAVVMKGKLWLKMHRIASVVLDCTYDDPTEAEVMKRIMACADDIADAVMATRGPGKPEDKE